MRRVASLRRIVFVAVGVAVAVIFPMGDASARAQGVEVGVAVARDVEVPMRDGVILRADVYRPAGEGPFPVLVLRTPYGKHGFHPEPYAKAGYLVVCQDARGRYASGGAFESFVRERTHDAEDGYDTVEWAAGLSGSTGKVGTFGVSYNAFLQWRLATLRPPSLVAMSAHSIPAHYTDLEGPGTIRPGRRLVWWATTLSPDLRRRTGRPGTHTSAEARALWDAGEGRNWLGFLPWIELPGRVFEDEAEAVRDWLRHPGRDPWKLDEGCPEINVPNLDVVGWFDHCHGDMLMYRTMVERGATESSRRGQRIVIGPWSHNAQGVRSYGAVDFGPDAALDLKSLEIRWFDHWLKGKPNGVDAEAPVRLFVMGADRWRDEREWPLKRARPMELFLDGDGRANGASGDGRLVADTPGRDAQDHYRYDPRDPVPSLHGPALYTIPADQRPLDARQDILVYQTGPLDDPVEVTGHAEVDLYVASSAPDTDFFARLIDVAPDGLARDVALGMVRARYRDPSSRPTWLTPGAVTRLRIRMGPTSNLFRRGHRIRLDVTSSDFPNYDRNHNTAEDQNADPNLAVADQAVYHGGPHASRLILPRIPPAGPGSTP